MKNIKFLSLITLALLIAACSNNFTPYQYKTGDSPYQYETSRVTVSIGGNARTILPVFDPETFDKYTVEAAKGSETIGPFDMVGESYTLDLEDGDWTITVKGYFTGIVDQNDEPIAIASGSAEITVSGNDINTVVFVNVPEAGGTGTLTYHILPANATGVSVVLKTIGTPSNEVYSSAILEDTTSVPSGIYLLFVTANGKTEVDVVHIYNGQTTIAAFDFDTAVLGSFPAYDWNQYTGGLSSSVPYQVVNIPDRDYVLKVSNVTEWAAALYDITDYVGLEITLSFKADVKRVGAPGMLSWQISNVGGNGYFPTTGVIENAAVDVWHEMSGTWTGIPNNENGTFIFLSTYENDSDITTYFIDNFEIQVVISDSSTYPPNYETVNTVMYELPMSYHYGSFGGIDGEGGEYFNSPLAKSGSPILLSINGGINVTNRLVNYDAIDVRVNGDYSLSAAPGDPTWGFGINTAVNNYKITVRGNAIGEVPAGAVMQLANNGTYSTLASSAISSVDNTFELEWNITQVFTNNGIRIQTNDVGKTMPFRVNLIVVEDLGEREAPAGASGGEKDAELNAEYVRTGETVFSLAEWITGKNALAAPLTNSGDVEIVIVNDGINIGTRAQDYQTLELNFKGANGIPNMVLADNIYKVTVYVIVLGDASTGEVRLQEPGGSYTTFVKQNITESADQTFKLVMDEIPANYTHNMIRIATGNTYPIRISLIEVEKTGERPPCECTDCALTGKKVSEAAGTYCTCAVCDDCYVCTITGKEPDPLPTEDTTTTYVPPSDGNGFFYLDLNDTKSFHAAGGSSTARPIIVSSTNKVDFTFNQNNQFLWVKLTSTQISNIISADTVKIDLTGTASQANSNFRYYLGYQAGSNWNATDAQGAGTISSLNGDKTMVFVTDRKNDTYVQYLVLRYDGTARTDVSIESIKVTYGTPEPELPWECECPTCDDPCTDPACTQEVCGIVCNCGCDNSKHQLGAFTWDNGSDSVRGWNLDENLRAKIADGSLVQFVIGLDAASVSTKGGLNGIGILLNADTMGRWSEDQKAFPWYYEDGKTGEYAELNGWISYTQLTGLFGANEVNGVLYLQYNLSDHAGLADFITALEGGATWAQFGIYVHEVWKNGASWHPVITAFFQEE